MVKASMERGWIDQGGCAELAYASKSLKVRRVDQPHFKTGQQDVAGYSYSNRLGRSEAVPLSFGSVGGGP